MNAHPDDILLCANLTERSEHRQFTDRQIVTLSRGMARLEGRRIRHIWYTAPAMQALNAMPTDSYFQAVRPLDHAMRLGGGALRNVEEWSADEPVSLIDRLRALECPASIDSQEAANAYYQGIEAAIEVITSTIVSALD